MSLQSKVITLIFVVFIAYGALDYGVQRLFILPSFEALERESARRDMDRAVQAIQREIQYLAAITSDWATWDDTYQFIQDHNEAYIKTNLGGEALKVLAVNFLGILDDAGRVAWAQGYDLQAEEKITLKKLPDNRRWPVEHPLLDLPELNSEQKGVLLTTHGPLLVTSKPVVTSSGAGPSRGAMVFGRFLNAATIAERTQVGLTISILNGQPLGPEESAIIEELGNSGEALIREQAEVNRVYRMMPDIFGQPALLLQVEAPKTISARGQNAIRYALLSLLGAGLIIVIVLVIGLRRMVLGPLQRLTEHAVMVGQSGDLSQRLTLPNQDELGVLAREFDQMVERVAATRRALIDQSYQSGIAEMASGVLHNIGNAITPLKVRVATVDSALRDAPTTEIRMALTELADPSIPEERRRDMQEFVDLAGQELATLVEETGRQLAGISHQVEHVQQILGDQERFSRAARVIEPVSAAELVGESVEVLGEELRQGVQIEMDESLRTTDALLGSRVALQQIVINLLKNAIEAIREQSPAEGGRIKVDASAEWREGQEMVHLRIADNGIGIDPAQLTRIFERGFSSKARNSGLGLHWCAVTATAMNGQLYAESAGNGQGACLHLLLPQAQD